MDLARLTTTSFVVAVVAFVICSISICSTKVLNMAAFEDWIELDCIVCLLAWLLACTGDTQRLMA